MADEHNCLIVTLTRRGLHGSQYELVGFVVVVLV